MNFDMNMDFMRKNDNFYFSMAAIVIPTITGSISFLSSLAIVVYICRSKINTIYHRILFIMSVADMHTSLAIALTTLPMPADVIYPYATPSYGTIATCNLQGYVYLSGSGLVLSMNGILNIYYVCTLKYHMKDEFFRRYVEPILYFAAITSSLFGPYFTVLRADLINPTTLESFCAPHTYPAGCNQGENDECRGTRKAVSDFDIMFYFSIILGVVTLNITMGLIMVAFYKKEKHLKQLYSSQSRICQHRQGAGEDHASTQHDTNTKKATGEGNRKSHEKIEDMRVGFEHAKKMRRIVNRQVIMYFVSFWLTWTCLIVNSLYLVAFEGNPDKIYFVQILRMLTQPSQGLFNMLIFFYHKVSLVRRIEEGMTFGEALRLLFLTPKQSKEMQAVLSISVVHEDNFELCNRRSNFNQPNIEENAGVDVVVSGVAGGNANGDARTPPQSRARAMSSQKQATSANQNEYFDDGVRLAASSKKSQRGNWHWHCDSGIDSNSLAAASKGRYVDPDHDHPSLGGLSGFSSFNGMLSFFSFGGSTNNMSTVRDSKNSNRETYINESVNAGLSVGGGGDSFQNEDMISYSSPGKSI